MKECLKEGQAGDLTSPPAQLPSPEHIVSKRYYILEHDNA